jgi:hypothetical protein
LLLKEGGGGFEPLMADPGFSVYIGLPTGWAYPIYAGLFGLTGVHTAVDGSAPSSQRHPPSPVLPSLMSFATLVNNCLPLSSLVCAYSWPRSPRSSPVSVTTGTGPCGGFFSPLYTGPPGTIYW